MSDTRPKYTLPSFGLIDINKKKKEKEAAAAKAKAEEAQSGDILSIRNRKKAEEKAGIAGGATAATSAVFLGTQPEADKKKTFGSGRRGPNRGLSQRGTSGNKVSMPVELRRDRKDRAEGGPGQGSGGVPLKKSAPVPPKPKMKPVMSSSGADVKATAATDKSRLAPKMTAFQRQKARQFEKEGVAGRSMTAAQAKRKASEKGSSVAGLRSLFGLSKVKSAPDKKSLSSEFRKKNLAANQKIGKKQ